MLGWESKTVRWEARGLTLPRDFLLFPPNVTRTWFRVAFCCGWVLTFCPMFISKSDISVDRQPIKAANRSPAEGPVACFLSNCRKGKQNLSDGKCQFQRIWRGEMRLQEEEEDVAGGGGQSEGQAGRGRRGGGMCNGEGDLVGGERALRTANL